MYENGTGTNITLGLSQKTRLSHIHYTYTLNRLRHHLLARNRILKIKMTDTTFISHITGPKKGSKSARDECKQNLLLNERQNV